MGYRFTRGDVDYLTSAAAGDALRHASGLPLAPATLIGDLTRLKAEAGDHAAAVAETVLLRRAAERRWSDAGPVDIPWRQWLFTDEALQQASPPPVAAYRARRVCGAAALTGYDAIHDVTCSIGADVVALAAAAGPDSLVLGSDIDPVRLAMARHNLAVSHRAARLTQADARTATSRTALRYADPARRDAAGRRITSADTIPSVAELDGADPAGTQVLRLPPGIDYDALGRRGEVEIVSWRGTVREAVSWPERLFVQGRRATVLDDAGGVTETLTDEDPSEEGVIPALRFLVDPDPAVVRAHLVRQYAARHGLARLDEHLAYLTGDHPAAGRRSFEILESAAFSEKTVRGWLRHDGAGTLEIKQRGTSVVPDELRRRLKPGGDKHVARTLILARIGRSTMAFWCRAMAPGQGRHTVG